MHRPSGAARVLSTASPFRRRRRGRAGELLIAGACLCLWSGEQTEAARPHVLTLVVNVDNRAGTAADVLVRAKAQASRIFMEAGVRIAWFDPPRDPDPGCDGFSLFITLLPPDMVRRLSTEGLSETALGSAAEGTGRASIHPQRVLELATRIHSSVGELLGRVIAHELGHLLLPPGHSPVGIMTAGLDTDPRTSAHFTMPQSRAIRALLESTATETEGQGACRSTAVARKR